jgi:hypothetical protein
MMGNPSPRLSFAASQNSAKSSTKSFFGKGCEEDQNSVYKGSNLFKDEALKIGIRK